jgi:hypothetical protein
MNAVSIIPAASRTKAQPVTASIRLPAGAANVQFWPITTEQMMHKVGPAGWRCTMEVRWKLPGGVFDDENKGGVEAKGDAEHIPGGIVDGELGQIPATVENFDFDPRQSPGGGQSVPPGAEFVQVVLIPDGGNNGGQIWMGAVLMADDAESNALQFDLGTRGS